MPKKSDFILVFANDFNEAYDWTSKVKRWPLSDWILCHSLDQLAEQNVLPGSHRLAFLPKWEKGKDPDFLTAVEKLRGGKSEEIAYP